MLARAVKRGLDAASRDDQLWFQRHIGRSHAPTSSGRHRRGSRSAVTINLTAPRSLAVPVAGETVAALVLEAEAVP